MPLFTVAEEVKALVRSPLLPDTAAIVPPTVEPDTPREHLVALQSRAQGAVKAAVGLNVALVSGLGAGLALPDLFVRSVFEASLPVAIAILVAAALTWGFAARYAVLQYRVSQICILAFVGILAWTAWAYYQTRLPDAASATAQCFAELASNYKELSEAERDLSRCEDGVAMEQFALEREALKNKNPAIKGMRDQLTRRCIAQQKWIDGVNRRRKAIELRGCTL